MSQFLSSFFCSAFLRNVLVKPCCDSGPARTGVNHTHSCLPVKGGKSRVPTVWGAEDDVAAARTRVHYTHSCLPVNGGEGHVSTVQGAEDNMAAARTWVYYTNSCVLANLLWSSEKLDI